MDWIQGDKFKEIADWTYSPKEKRGDDYDNLPNTFDQSKIRNGDIIYSHTGYAQKLLDVVSRLDKQVTLITHNGDINIDDSFVVPDNVIKWYTQNVNVIHPKIESIPIGLENDRWFQGIHKKEKMLAKLREPRKYKNLVYMNHNIGTNPAKRVLPYQIFEGKSWVRAERGTNGNRFDEYLDNIYNHKFVICPEGNGMDTHRTWESLYMGTIPIEKFNINNQFYTDLPTVVVKDWAEITEESLMKWLTISGSIAWNMEKLNFEYWKNKIRNETF